MERIRHWAVIGTVCGLMLIFAVCHWLLPDLDVSTSERRKLQQTPAVSWETVQSGEYMEDLETYLLDHFPLREQFRALKASVALHLLGRQENNDLYYWQGGIYKQEYPLREKELDYGAKKLNSLYEKYLQGMNVYYAVIPDKSHYVAQDAGQLQVDLSQLRQQLREGITPEIQEIELVDCLTAEDYYLTDPHWRQEKLDRVLDRLADTLDIQLSPISAYETTADETFYGAYAGQVALPVDAEALVYLQNDVTQAATVETLENGEVTGLYPAPESMDGYDRYLGGAAALQVLTNPNGPQDRELVIFRDSFGSSLAPLLLEAYGRITLIDLRYISSDMLTQWVSFENQDVLFLYSTLVWNHSTMLR